MAGGSVSVVEAWPPVAALEIVSHATPEELASYLATSILAAQQESGRPTATEQAAVRLVGCFQSPDVANLDEASERIGVHTFVALAAAAQVEVASQTYRAFGHPAPEGVEGLWYEDVLYPGTIRMGARSTKELAVLATLTTEPDNASERIVESMVGAQFKTPEPVDGEPSLTPEQRGLVAATQLILATTIFEKFGSGDTEGVV